jgi:hypothetical protein
MNAIPANDNIPTQCPLCGGALEVDEEYMLSMFGPAYEYMPWQQWSFYCDECDAAGPWITEFEKENRP